MAGTNDIAFERGKKRMKDIVYQTIYKAFKSSAIDLIKDAEVSKQFHNLTGNTLTSYLVGLYYNRSLIEILDAMSILGLRPPTHEMLSRGDGIGVVSLIDYDSGRVVHVKKYKLQDTEGGYGNDVSERFLRNFKTAGSGFSLVMCTGTSYSSYLEFVKGLNVLEDTMLYAEMIFRKNLKKVR